MNRLPIVRKFGPSVFVWKPTEEAKRVEAENRKQGSAKALPHDLVHERAVKVAQKNGIISPSINILRGLYEIQIGKYHGQTFRWLVENDMGYVTFLLCQVEAEGGNTGPGALNDNKRQLKWYLESFPDGRAALQQRRKELKQHSISKMSLASQRSSTPTTSQETLSREKTPSKRPKLQIASAQDRTTLGEEMDDEELLTEVETLESSQQCSQPNDGGSKPQTSAKMEDLSSARPLSELRTVSSVTASLSQPEEYPLPADWKNSLPEEDKKWVSKAICRYDARGKLQVQPSQLWYQPPQPPLIPSQCPSIDRYFAHSLFVWMPKLLWRVRLYCVNPTCDRHEVVRAGVYKVVRQVLSTSSFYLMVTERYECTRCKAKYVGWSRAMVNQLDVARRVQFPVLLTYRYACDESVVSLLRSRGLGNSATQLQKKLVEQHWERYLRCTAQYVSDCKGFATSSLIKHHVFAKPPSAVSLPKFRWLQHVYCLDVLSRIDEVKAFITSTFGRILKLDSTKKVAKKLSGHSRGMAAWATNVGNEDGQVLNSVLTCEEGHFGLKPMVDGIIQRYSSAGVPPPEVLYVDRGCCGQSFTRTLFGKWPSMAIRLDIWHFMRRFSAGCTTDAHQLYGVFMSRLSKCIFEWSHDDLGCLRKAKMSELRQRMVHDPSDEDVLRWLTKCELALHCRRRTRGVGETTRLIGELLEAFHGPQGLDTLGVPLFDREKMTHIWESQSKHVGCIQDPEGVSLYTLTGHVTKGTVRLPVYRCARGSVSLESFHLHLARFIPGTTASESHFQAFLLDGLRRWNEDRRMQGTSREACPSYSGLLSHAVNVLCLDVWEERFVPEFKVPRKYTGEKIGVEYLFSQTGKVLQDLLSDSENEDLAQLEQDGEASDTDEEEEEDEGFEDSSMDDPTQPPVELDQIRPSRPSPRKSAPTPERPTTPEQDEQLPIGDNQTERMAQSDAVDAHQVGGFSQVERLAEYLFSLRDQTEPISMDQASHIIRLWDNLSDYDKQPTVPTPRHRSRLTKGSVTTFKVRSKESFVPGTDSVKRAFHGTEGGIAQRPDSNRIMELVIVKLCSACPSPRKERGVRVDRWTQVSRAYRHIRELFLACGALQRRTGIVLFQINHATLLQWFNKRTRDQEREMLLQNLRLGEPPMVAKSELPPARVRDPVAEASPVPPTEQHEYVLPPSTVGTIRKRRVVPVSESPADPESKVTRMPRPLRFILPSPVFAPMFAPAPEPTKPTTGEKLPKTTKWYRDRQEKKKAAGEYVRQYSVRRQTRMYNCSKCGRSRTMDTHKQYYGHWYCASTATESFEEWRSSREKCRQEERFRKHQDNK